MFGLHDRLPLDKKFGDKSKEVGRYLGRFKVETGRRCFSKRIGLFPPQKLCFYLSP